MFQAGALTLFRIRGIPIRAHWTLLLILPYLAFVLSLQFPTVAQLAGVEGRQLLLPPLAWGAILAALLFVSVTLHELAHTFLAIRYGGRVRSVTLMLLGGVSEISRMPRGAYQEAIMAAAGPATSLALGGVLVGLSALTRGLPVDLQMGLFYLAAMNITVGVFNLLPAFPMDGGRILRALLAARIDRDRATAIAARVGKLFALGFGALGLLGMNFLLLLIAVFVWVGAQRELEGERVRGALEGLRVLDLLRLRREPVPTIAAHATFEDALARMRELDRLELVVVDDRGGPVNVIDASDLVSHAGPPLTVGDFAGRLPPRYAIVDARTPASEALEEAAESGAPHLLVTDDEARPHEIIALVAASDLARAITLRALANRFHRPAHAAA